MTSAQDLKDWLTGFSTQNIQIWCEDPETTTTPGIMSKSYLTYRILMKQVGRDIVGVRHRYSEFEALRTNLKDRYATMGILIPSLPPKPTVTSMVSKTPSGATSIKERTLGLSTFCEAVVTSPWLKNDTQWINFMKPPVANGVVISNDNGNNVGETKLIEVLSYLDIPYKYTMSQRMEDIKQEVLLIEKNVKVLLDKVRVVQHCEKALAQANDNVLGLMSVWIDNERSGVKSLAGRAFDENDSLLTPPELLTSSLNSTTQLLRNKFNSLDNNDEYTGLTLATILEQEVAMIESFKELFKVHEEILSSIDSLSNKLSKMETSKNANKEALCFDLRKNLDEKQTVLTAFYKGFIYFSLPLSARQRALTIRKLTSAIASSMLTSSFALQKHCLTYFESLNISPSSAIAETCRMLELLGIKPLEKLPEEFSQLPGQDISIFSGSMETLFNRAIIIGKGKTGAQAPYVPAPGEPARGFQSDIPVENRGTMPVAVIGASVPIAGDTPQKANPLAVRRGSAVLGGKGESFMGDGTPRSPVPSSTAGGTAENQSPAADKGDDNVSELNSKFEIDLNISTPAKGTEEQTEDAPVVSSVPTTPKRESASLPAPLTEKSKSLLGNLMGDNNDEEIGSAAASKNVWD